MDFVHSDRLPRKTQTSSCTIYAKAHKCDHDRDKRFARVPLATAYLSPARAISTISWRRIMSSVRGSEPAGISLEFSCMRTRCQSANLLSCLNNAHLSAFEQVAFLHTKGCPTDLNTHDFSNHCS